MGIVSLTFSRSALQSDESCALELGVVVSERGVEMGLAVMVSLDVVVAAGAESVGFSRRW